MDVRSTRMLRIAGIVMMAVAIVLMLASLR